jgi:hypothetical protein
MFAIFMITWSRRIGLEHQGPYTRENFRKGGHPDEKNWWFESYHVYDMLSNTTQNIIDLGRYNKSSQNNNYGIWTRV